MPNEFGMSLFIKIKCPNCKQKLSIDDSELKQKITCGLCGYIGFL